MKKECVVYLKVENMYEVAFTDPKIDINEDDLNMKDFTLFLLEAWSKFLSHFEAERDF